MGAEISTYIDAVVSELQAAYGPNWGIEKRPESPGAVSGRPWAVQIGYSRGDPEERGDLGINLRLMCCATVAYASVGPTHASGFQSADIAATLAAYISGHVMGGKKAFNISIEPEPMVDIRGGGVEVATGQYLNHVFWTVTLDDILPDLDIPGYETLHPQRPGLERYYWEIEIQGGGRLVVLGPEDTAPELPANGLRARKIVFADAGDVPADTSEVVYYPVLLELE